MDMWVTSDILKCIWRYTLGLISLWNSETVLKFSFSFTAPISMISNGRQFTEPSLPRELWFHSKSNTIYWLIFLILTIY